MCVSLFADSLFSPCSITIYTIIIEKISKTLNVYFTYVRKKIYHCCQQYRGKVWPLFEQLRLKFNGTETNHNKFFFHATGINPNWICIYALTDHVFSISKMRILFLQNEIAIILTNHSITPCCCVWSMAPGLIYAMKMKYMCVTYIKFKRCFYCTKIRSAKLYPNL